MAEATAQRREKYGKFTVNLWEILHSRAQAAVPIPRTTQSQCTHMVHVSTLGFRTGTRPLECIIRDKQLESSGHTPNCTVSKFGPRN